MQLLLRTTRYTLKRKKKKRTHRTKSRLQNFYKKAKTQKNLHKNTHFCLLTIGKV